VVLTSRQRELTNELESGHVPSLRARGQRTATRLIDQLAELRANLTASALAASAASTADMRRHGGRKQTGRLDLPSSGETGRYGSRALGCVRPPRTLEDSIRESTLPPVVTAASLAKNDATVEACDATTRAAFVERKARRPAPYLFFPADELRARAQRDVTDGRLAAERRKHPGSLQFLHASKAPADLGRVGRRRKVQARGHHAALARKGFGHQSFVHMPKKEGARTRPPCSSRAQEG
jgi:hypothetical protein